VRLVFVVTSGRPAYDLGMRRRFHVLVAVSAAATFAACGPSGRSSGTAPPDGTAATTAGSADAATSTMAPGGTAAMTDVAEDSAPELCDRTTTAVLGTVENPALDEASGLVASRRHRGVLWAHNDGGGDIGVFALGTDGADLGFHPVTIEGARDVEDIAMFSGPNGDEILLADIGDNEAGRPSIRIYRFAEPDPALVAPITDVEVLEFVYPDRPHNAEVLLVDEADGRIVIVTKEQQPVEGIPPEFGPTAPSFVFEGPLEGHDSTPVELTAVGALDAPLLETRTVTVAPHPSSLLGFGGVPTGGDVSPDGGLIALRTYETVWLWSRAAGTSVAGSLSSEPCQVRTAPERQGEAVAFLDGTLLTVSEGLNPSLHGIRP
jgi:hypothetical protein